MNLSLRDIRHDLGRFLLTGVGLGLLLAIVLAMTGIYNGMVADGTALPDSFGADLWVVQRDTRGPFAELSRVAPDLEDRARTVPGVQRARSYVSHTLQRERPGGGLLRFTAIGLSWPLDRGDQVPISEGRSIREPHFEMVADRSLGLPLGERVRLGRETYTVVGIAQGMLASGGDPLVFFTLADAQRVQSEVANEAVRLEREARVARVRGSELARDPESVRRARGTTSGIPALGPPAVAAVMIDLATGADPDAVRASLRAWPDVTVYTTEEQRALLLQGVIDRARRQIGLFRGLLVVISTILMGLIIYTMTIDKLHSIALLKLLGARRTVIAGLILEQALLLGLVAYLIALVLAATTFSYFPRRVVIGDAERLGLLLVVAAISVGASMVGLWKALAADPNQVLAS